MSQSRLLLGLLLLGVSTDALAQRQLFEVEGTSTGDSFGTLVRAAGDVDADGVQDFMVASREGLGRVFIYSGATRAVLHDFSSARTYLGRSMDGLGDVDGDGMGDFAISDVDFSQNQPSLVRVISGLTGAELYAVSSIFLGVDRLGTSLRSIADVDGDGRRDLLVYATDGCCPTESQVIGISGATGAEIFRLLTPTSSSDDFGWRMTGLDDIDGDGVGDFALGDPNFLATGGSIVRGRVLVYSGATRSQIYSIEGTSNTFSYPFALADAGDVDGDGVGDLLIGGRGGSSDGFVQVISGVSGAEILRLDGIQSGDDFGEAVAGVGDVDGDGRADFIVGAPDTDPFVVNAGAAYVYSGATGSELFRVEGDVLSEKVGTSVLGAGDLDGDGLDDVLIGRPRFVSNATAPGSVSCHQLGQDPMVIGFELDDDLVTPLENGRRVDANARFGNQIRVRALGAGHFGAATFDSSPRGPNARGSDPDLLVNSGNLLILQENPLSTVPGIFDVPDDAEGGGTLRIEFRSLARPVSIDVVDICPGDADARVRLIDTMGFTRTFHVPAGFTADGLADPGQAAQTLQLLTLSPQAGVSATATAVEDTGFHPNQVVALEVYMESSGAIDNLSFQPSGLPPADELRRLYVVPTPPNGAGFGSRVRSLSDLDGDGAPELLASQQNSASGLGVARLFSGATGRLMHEFPAQQMGSLFGDVVAGVGDVDGDGLEDIGVGGWDYDVPGESRNGVVRIYSGRTFALLYELFGESGARTGTEVERLGDLDGDGRGEFLVGSNSANGGRGRIDVRSGATGAVVMTIAGVQPGEALGSWVRNAGDVNADGVDDILSSFGNILGFQVYSGADGSLLHEIPGTGYGSMPAGDVDLDGHADILLKDWTSSTLYVQVISGCDGSVLYEVRGVPAPVSQFRTAPAGDQDGDGHADFAVEAPFDPVGPDPSGRRIQVFSGRTGLVLFEQQIEGGSNPFEYAGDLDGDGFGELLRSVSDGSATGLEALAVRRPNGFAVCAGPENSTGLGARLLPQGSFVVAEDDLVMKAVDLPGGAMVLLLSSTTFGRLALGGPQGAVDLCIAGAPVQRLGLAMAGSASTATFPLSLATLVGPGQPTSALVGESRFFQCYYRDFGGGGNVSDAVIGLFE